MAPLAAAGSDGEKEPLLLRAAKGEKVERVPVWMMRQAGRHMQVGACSCLCLLPYIVLSSCVHYNAHHFRDAKEEAADGLEEAQGSICNVSNFVLGVISGLSRSRSCSIYSLCRALTLARTHALVLYHLFSCSCFTNSFS